MVKIYSMFCEYFAQSYFTDLNFLSHLVRSRDEGLLNILHEAIHDVHENDSNQYTNGRPNEFSCHAAGYDAKHNECEADILPGLAALIGISWLSSLSDLFHLNIDEDREHVIERITNSVPLINCTAAQRPTPVCIIMIATMNHRTHATSPASCGRSGLFLFSEIATVVAPAKKMNNKDTSNCMTMQTWIFFKEKSDFMDVRGELVTTKNFALPSRWRQPFLPKCAIPNWSWSYWDCVRVRLFKAEIKQ